MEAAMAENISEHKKKRKFNFIFPEPAGAILYIGCLIVLLSIIIFCHAKIDGINETLELFQFPAIQYHHSQISKKNKIASWYDYSLQKVLWSKNHRTAASRDLPRYSYAKVTNIENGKSVIVFINDYGPAEYTGRDIDLSSYAFSQISNLKLGLANVIIEPYPLK